MDILALRATLNVLVVPPTLAACRGLVIPARETAPVTAARKTGSLLVDHAVSVKLAFCPHPATSRVQCSMAQSATIAVPVSTECVPIALRNFQTLESTSYVGINVSSLIISASTFQTFVRQDGGGQHATPFVPERI